MPLILTTQSCHHRHISLRFIWLNVIITFHRPFFLWGHNQLGHNHYYWVALNNSLRIDHRLLTIMVFEGTLSYGTSDNGFDMDESLRSLHHHHISMSKYPFFIIKHQIKSFIICQIIYHVSYLPSKANQGNHLSLINLLCLYQVKYFGIISYLEFLSISILMISEHISDLMMFCWHHLMFFCLGLSY